MFLISSSLKFAASCLSVLLWLHLSYFDRNICVATKSYKKLQIDKRQLRCYFFLDNRKYYCFYESVKIKGKHNYKEILFNEPKNSLKIIHNRQHSNYRQLECNMCEHFS